MLSHEPRVNCVETYNHRGGLYTVPQKNDTDVAHYNFNAHQLILVIFGRDAAE